ncbi:MAG: prolipoprotein diacylglyceryl transferase [Clostridia bacterium]|nr:prolipoprotein diacylglyceryl transferase [Clostridia bacterium]
MHGSGTIAFPGLGIGEFSLNRVAFRIFGKEIYWYGILIAAGFFLAVLLAQKLGEHNGLDSDDILNMVLIAAPVAIVGARAYYVLTTLDQYHSLYEVIAIWNGGIAIYGAILAGMAVLILYSLVKKLPILKVLDVAAPCVILGQAIGRWGNFVNQEAFGRETALPWRMELLINGVRTCVHPTFLYESLWDFAGLLLLVWVFYHCRAEGETTCLYFFWYGVGRFFIEGLRTDSLYLGSFRISQLVSVALCIAAVALYSRVSKKRAGTAKGDDAP